MSEDSSYRERLARVAASGRANLASSIPWTIVGLHLGAALHVAIGGCAFALAAPVATWPATLEGLFVMGSVLTLSSFLALGRRFGILPGVRSVVTRGPYRSIRHPAYLRELFMVLATTLSRPGLCGFLVFCCAVLLVGLLSMPRRRFFWSPRAIGATRKRRLFRLVPGLW